jgi:hypothetical protein
MVTASVEVDAAAVDVRAAAMPVGTAAMPTAAMPAAAMPATAVIAAATSWHHDDPTTTPTIRHARAVYVTVVSGSAAACRECDRGWHPSGGRGKWHCVRGNGSSEPKQRERRRKSGFSH